MSLVNDALRKARLEAARQEAKRSGAILPTLGHVRMDREPGFPNLLTLILLVLGTASLAVLLYVALSGEPEAVPRLDAADNRFSPPHPSEVITPIDDATAEPRPSASEPAIPEAPPIAAPLEPGPAARQTPAQNPQASKSWRAEPEPPPRSETDLARPAGASSSERQQPGPAPQVSSAASAPPRSLPASVPEPRIREDSVAPAIPAEEAGATDSDLSEQPNAVRGEMEHDLGSFVREAEIPGIGAFRLDGIAWSSDRPFALINGQVIGPGGFVDGATVTEVAPDRVVFERDDRHFEIKLR
jgi:hypothetical protein